MSEMPALPAWTLQAVEAPGLYALAGEAPARAGGAAIEVTRLARPLGLLVPVTFAPTLWAFCEAGAAGAGVDLEPDRIARYLLTGLVRAVRRAGGEPPALLPYRMALGQLEITLVARIGPDGVFVSDGRAIAHPPRQVG